MSEQTFKEIYKSVQNLDAGSTVNFNGFPMVVRECTTTYNRYYGEMLWIKQLDGELNIDVTLNVKIDFDSDSVKQVSRFNEENDRLKSEVYELKKEIGIMSSRQLPQVFNLLEIEQLKADIERLKNAGDEMATVINQYRCSPWGRIVPNAFSVWNAWFSAKKGNHS
jgi:hypothetical protein